MAETTNTTSSLLVEEALQVGDQLTQTLTTLQNYSEKIKKFTITTEELEHLGRLLDDAQAHGFRYDFLIFQLHTLGVMSKNVPTRSILKEISVIQQRLITDLTALNKRMKIRHLLLKIKTFFYVPQ